MQIRRATGGEIGDVLRIERSVPEAPHWNESAYGAILQEDVDTALHRTLFVAIHDGRTVGFAVATVVAGQAELESIAVDPGQRRLGAGRALSEAAMRWATHMGAERMLLEVRSKNAAARALYERMGFQQTGFRPGYYSGPADDAVQMARAVSALLVTPIDNEGSFPGGKLPKQPPPL